MSHDKSLDLEQLMSRMKFLEESHRALQLELEVLQESFAHAKLVNPPTQGEVISGELLLARRASQLVQDLYSEGYVDVFDGVAVFDMDLLQEDAVLPEDLSADALMHGLKISGSLCEVPGEAIAAMGWDPLPESIVACQIGKV